jgi:hypothetical protein
VIGYLQEPKKKNVKTCCLMIDTLPPLIYIFLVPTARTLLLLAKQRNSVHSKDFPRDTIELCLEIRWGPKHDGAYEA